MSDEKTPQHRQRILFLKAIPVSYLFASYFYAIGMCIWPTASHSVHEDPSLLCAIPFAPVLVPYVFLAYHVGINESGVVWWYFLSFLLAWGICYLIAMWMIRQSARNRAREAAERRARQP